MIDWYIEGLEMSICNCDYGCPCQFEADPTHGHCRGFEVLRIDRGHYGDVNLDGLNIGMFYAWPGLISEGKGELQAIIDERVDESQRNALETILHGKETEEAATHWWVFAAMSETIHPTLYRPIDFEIDVDAATGRVAIPGVIDASGEPIRPDHTSDAVHRAQIVIPNGIEFELAEMGSASASTGDEAAVALDLKNCYAQFNQLRHSGSGIVKGH